MYPEHKLHHHCCCCCCYYSKHQLLGFTVVSSFGYYTVPPNRAELPWKRLVVPSRVDTVDPSCAWITPVDRFWGGHGGG